METFELHILRQLLWSTEGCQRISSLIVAYRLERFGISIIVRSHWVLVTFSIPCGATVEGWRSCIGLKSPCIRLPPREIDVGMGWTHARQVRFSEACRQLCNQRNEIDNGCTDLQSIEDRQSRKRSAQGYLLPTDGRGQLDYRRRPNSGGGVNTIVCTDERPGGVSSTSLFLMDF